ncbi:large ribosomal subunit protein bL21m [Magnolia sinica]|uniref:large ribosomal subunit protein bL21m n=1 Tax=Magnolia sinica TaxID=86752 RepID=UPI00265828DA|nr:large ribosomal subunit protein bL21m [Magnolia sinica]
MANRRCINALITRHSSSLLSPSHPLHKSKTLALPLHHALYTPHLESPPSIPLHEFHSLCCGPSSFVRRHFSSITRHSDKEGEGEEEEEDEGEEEEGEGEGEGEEEEEAGEISDGDDDVPSSNCVVNRTNSTAEKEEEAAAIGYKVIGPLNRSERLFKPWEPVFAVVQIGSHQFKVSNGDSIFTERLKHCEVNDKLILNRVLMLGSTTQTIIGRPILLDAAVHAVVEEHALDAKVIIFKKKRRKNYRRTKGHRQELTKLRITDIQGIEKPEKAAVAA